MKIMKIGMYKDKEILEQLTKGDGNSFIGRSMYDAIINKLDEQQKSYTEEFNFRKELELENERLKIELEYGKRFEQRVDKFLKWLFKQDKERLVKYIDIMNKCTGLRGE